MIGAGIFSIIGVAAEISGQGIIRQTSANLVLIWLSVLTCFVSLGFLVYQTFSENPLTVYILIGVLLLSFLIELIYTAVIDCELQFTPLSESFQNSKRRETIDK